VKNSTKENLNRAIGARIARARKSAGWSQAKLGDIVGVSTSTLCRIERGDQELTVPRAHDFADVLGVPVGRLISSHGVEQ
jgi:transcriptional regulator with XRE-family HTH domain